MYKIVKVDKLGALCAFRAKEIQVVASLYDSVPADKLEDFGIVLNKAREKYESLVSESKAGGEKLSSGKCKSKAVFLVLNPWLERMGIAKSTPVRTIVSKNPGIPSNKVKVDIVSGKIDKERIAKIYNQFPSESLEDSMPGGESPVDAAVGNNVFEDVDVFNLSDDSSTEKVVGGDKVDFEDLLK